MAATNEQRIVWWLLEHKDVQPLKDRKVDAAWFFTAKHRDAVVFILAHQEKYGAVPTVTTFKSHMGAYDVKTTSESIDYLLDTQAQAAQFTAVQRAQVDVEEALDDDDGDAAVERLREALTEVETYISTPPDLVDSMDNDRVDERWESYEKRETGGLIIGYSSGFPTLDATTLGIQKGHLITVVAMPKVGKTTLCLAISNHIYWEHKQPILFLSFEMGAHELEMRQESLMANINFRKLQSGTLTPPEKDDYEDFLDKVVDDHDWPFWIAGASAGGTVSALEAQIERLKPGLCVVDGIYMMADEQTGEMNTPQALTNITRALKRVATRHQIPLIINSQALSWKSKGHRLTLDSIGYASSFSQDSDLVLGLERMKPGSDENDSAYDYERILRIMASRNTAMIELDIDFDYDKGLVQEQ